MKFSILVFATILVLPGCKSDNKPCTLSQATLSGTYKITAEITKSSTGEINNSFSAWADCKKDDLYTYNSNGTFNYTEGVTQCDPALIEYTQNWSLLGNELTQGNQKGSISDFTCNSFKLFKLDDVSGLTITTTYSRQ
jgi:hypothetical protein